MANVWKWVSDTLSQFLSRFPVNGIDGMYSVDSDSDSGIV